MDVEVFVFIVGIEYCILVLSRCSTGGARRAARYMSNAPSQSRGTTVAITLLTGTPAEGNRSLQSLHV